MLDAISIINSGESKIALVVNDQNQLTGTVTDGDIRRAILRGASTDTGITEVMNREYRHANQQDKSEEILRILNQKKLRQIPVLDENKRIVRLVILEEIEQEKVTRNPVVIMAGGQGKRLRPYTNNCPKPMLPIGGKPMLEIIIEQFSSQGFKDFYISVNYLKDQIINYFEDGHKLGVRISYLIEEEQLGTAGSLSLLPNSFDQPILVINGDVLTRLNPSQLIDFHVNNKSSATLCVRKEVYKCPYGVINSTGVILESIEEKPVHEFMVNAGIYVISPTAIDLIQPGRYLDMPELFHRLRSLDKFVTVYPLHEYWLDIGLPETLIQAENEWL